MVITVGQAMRKLEKLKTELSGIKQGINFFRHSPYSRIRKSLEVEQMKIEDEIAEIEEALNSSEVRVDVSSTINA